MFDVGMFGIKVVKKRDDMHGHFFAHMIWFFSFRFCKKMSDFLASQSLFYLFLYFQYFFIQTRKTKNDFYEK